MKTEREIKYRIIEIKKLIGLLGIDSSMIDFAEIRKQELEWVLSKGV